jgi:hypothetical protein
MATIDGGNAIGNTYWPLDSVLWSFLIWLTGR